MAFEGALSLTLGSRAPLRRGTTHAGVRFGIYVPEAFTDAVSVAISGPGQPAVRRPTVLRRASIQEGQGFAVAPSLDKC